MSSGAPSVTKVQLHKTTPEEKGLVQQAKDSITSAGKPETKASDPAGKDIATPASKDPDELDKEDFEEAARKAKEAIVGKEDPGNASSKSVVQGLQEQAAGAFDYLQGALKPKPGEDTDDPELRQWREAAAETAAEVRDKVKPANTPKEQTPSDKAETSRQMASDKSMFEQASEAVGNVWARLAPGRPAYAMGKDGRDHGAAAREEFKAAGDDFSKAATETKDAIVDSAKYVGDRLTAPATGDKDTSVRDAAKDTADRTGDWARDKGHAAQDKVDRTADWAKDKVDQGKQYARDQPSDADVKAGARSAADSARDAAEQAKDTTVGGLKYLAGRFTAPVTGDEKEDKRQIDRAQDKAQDAKDSVRGAAHDAKESTRGAYHDTKDSTRGAAQDAHDSARGVGHNLREGVNEAVEEGKSLLQKAYDSVADAVRPHHDLNPDKVASREDPVEASKRRAAEVREQWEEKMVPHTQEEALASSGYIPSNTEDLLKQGKGSHD